MKQKGFRIYAILVGLALILALTSGKLAQPERNSPERDRFVGFQLCYENVRPQGDGMAQDRSDWTVYGNEELAIPGMGKTTVERRVLVGQYDEENNRYIFPGMEGLNCLITRQTSPDGTEHVNFQTDLADADKVTHVNRVDGDRTENTWSLSGTAFFGPPLDDRKWNTEDSDFIWTPYEVYQMADGTVYLTGTPLGSYGGVGGFTISQEESYDLDLGGGPEGHSIQIEAKLESVERVVSVEVKAFDENDRELSTRTLTMDEIGDGLDLELEEHAAWALVTETDRNGRVKRTAHSLDNADQKASHRLVRLDDDGLGHVVYLELRR